MAIRETTQLVTGWKLTKYDKKNYFAGKSKIGNC